MLLLGECAVSSARNLFSSKYNWAEHLFKRKSRLLFIYDDTPEGGGRGARGKFCRNEKDGRYTILNYKVDEPGKGGKIHFFKTASRSDDGGGRGAKIKYNSLQRR